MCTDISVANDEILDFGHFNGVKKTSLATGTVDHKDTTNSDQSITQALASIKKRRNNPLMNKINETWKKVGININSDHSGTSSAHPNNNIIRVTPADESKEKDHAAITHPHQLLQLLYLLANQNHQKILYKFF